MGFAGQVVRRALSKLPDETSVYTPTKANGVVLSYFVRKPVEVLPLPSLVLKEVLGKKGDAFLLASNFPPVFTVGLLVRLEREGYQVRGLYYGSYLNVFLLKKQKGVPQGTPHRRKGT